MYTLNEKKLVYQINLVIPELTRWGWLVLHRGLEPRASSLPRTRSTPELMQLRFFVIRHKLADTQGLCGPYSPDIVAYFHDKKIAQKIYIEST